MSWDDSDEIYNPKQFDPNNPFNSPSGQGTASTPSSFKQAGILDSPTQTTNALRPRTVAAGWESTSGPVNNTSTGTLTVVFRDGTVYNFYDVPIHVWNRFSDSQSKGRYYLNHAGRNQSSEGILFQYAHGIADPATLSTSLQLAVRAAHSVARQRQVAATHTTGKKHRTVDRGGKNTYTVGSGRGRAHSNTAHTGAMRKP